MQSSLTLGNTAALFSAMLILAFIPSVSVLTVSARSAAFGFMHGVFTTIGIAVADIIFIVFAIYGLVFLAESMGSFFVFIKYLGGAYLIWLGIGLWRFKPNATVSSEKLVESSLLSSFLAGLLLTLADQKAIFFYLGFLPAFLDLSTVSFLDTGIIVVIATVSIGIAKLSYALMADRATGFFKDSVVTRGISIVAGTVMIMIGIFLVFKM